MKLLSLISPEMEGKTWGPVDRERVYDLGKRPSLIFPDLKSELAKNIITGIPIMNLGSADFNTDTMRYLPVIENPGEIFCIGINYLDERLEFEQTIDTPTLFMRFPDSPVGHGEDVGKPECSNEFDYEGEHVVIIGNNHRQ